MAKSDWVKLLISILFTVGLGGISGVVTVQEIPHWYAGLHKPSFNPPNSLFGPVWSILYVLMGISAWLVWKQPASSNRNQALLLFLFQFLLVIHFFRHAPVGLGTGGTHADVAGNSADYFSIRKIFFPGFLVIGTLYQLGEFCRIT